MAERKTALCRWPIDNRTSKKLTLPDGRTLGYAQYGLPDGKPVLYCHGFPGSRIESALLHEDAKRLGLRIIAPDRPGMGWSSLDPNRTMLSTVKDMEVLVNHLELEKYGILGISGGGPYALACAKAHPAQKVRAISVVCGLGSYDMGFWGMAWPNYLGWTYASWMTPSIVRWYMAHEPAAKLWMSYQERMENLEQAFAKGRHKMHPEDANLLGDRNIMRYQLANTKESLGPHGLVNSLSVDQKVLISNWGFRIGDIRRNLPVLLIYARPDQNVPLQNGQKINDRIGQSAQLVIKEDDTHASVSLYKEEYLKFLADVL